ncbi:MAG: sulfite exporter TauE/SafE family protein [Anaerolineae bacterium]
MCFAGVLLIGAYFMYRPVKNYVQPSAPRHWWQWHRTKVAEEYAINVLIIVPTMLVAGFVAGLLGVGGGLIKVPAVVLLGGVPVRIAVGSSSLMVGITALTGFIGQFLRGHFNAHLTVVLALAVLLGSQIGPRLAIKIERDRLQKYFALLLVAISLWLIYSVVRELYPFI